MNSIALYVIMYRLETVCAYYMSSFQSAYLAEKSLKNFSFMKCIQNANGKLVISYHFE